MYTRIARFADTPETTLVSVSGTICDELRRPPGDGVRAPAPRLERIVAGIEVAADRERRELAVIVAAESEERLNAADRILNSLATRDGGWGRKVASDTYTVEAAAELRRAA